MKKNNIKNIMKKNIYDESRVKKVIFEDKKTNIINYLPYLVGALTVIIMSVLIFNGKENTIKVNYKGYLSENKIIETNRDKIKKDINTLNDNYEANKISDNDYFEELNRLKTNDNKLFKEQKNLKEKYKIENNMNLKKVEFSKNKEMDSKLKDFYTKKQEIEKMDDDLDIEEDKIEAAYKNGDITKEEFFIKKRELDAKEDALDEKEDELEALAKKYGFDDDDDEDDDNDEDDDDNDDDDDDDDDDDMDSSNNQTK